MKFPLTAAAAMTAIVFAGCADQRTAEAERDETRRETRPPAAAEVPPADIPPEMPPEPAGRRVEPRPESGPELEIEDPEPEPQPEPEAPVEATPGQSLETIATDSGLIIEILRRGDGVEVREGETVVIHYHGTLADGRTFDSSYDRGEPATLNLFETVRGWQEGIPGMRVGGKRRLIIPPELGYGQRRTGSIPANSMLIFEVEVIDVVR